MPGTKMTKSYYLLQKFFPRCAQILPPGSFNCLFDLTIIKTAMARMIAHTAPPTAPVIILRNASASSLLLNCISIAVSRESIATRDVANLIAFAADMTGL